MKKTLFIVLLICIKQLNAQCVLNGTISGTVIDTATCNINNTGNITGISFSSSTGTPAYRYQWYNYYSSMYYSPLQNDTLLNLSNVISGNYALQITDANGCKTSISDTSFIFNVPNSISVSVNLIAPTTNTITLIVQYSSHVSSAIWNWYDGTPNDTTLYPTHNFSSVYTPTVCVMAVDSTNGCTAYDCVILNVCPTCNYNTMSVEASQNGNTTTDIKQLPDNNQVTVYPNPSNGVFNILVNDFENISIEIFNALGQKVTVQKLQTNITPLNLADFADGIYNLRVIKSNTLIYQNKIIKQ